MLYSIGEDKKQGRNTTHGHYDPTMARLVEYKSSADLLDAVTPHLLPHREWQSHLVLGLNLENRSKPTNPRDFYTATWIGEELQIIVFHFHKLPINATPCREFYDMRFYEQQLDLLVEYITTRPKETMAEYTTVTAPEPLSTQLSTRIASKLRCHISVMMKGRLSYTDKVKFTPHHPQDPTHSIRKATLNDNLQIVQLVHEFQQSGAHLRPATSLEEIVKAVPRLIGQGLYSVYVLPDDTIASVVMVRRPTTTGLAIVMVATSKAHRRKGYASTLTSWVIQNAFDPIEKEGRGREHVCIIWDLDGDAARIYKRLGFVEGQPRVDWKLDASTPWLA
jgi:GNAT superfamily N-acetyltransferase